MFIILAFAGWLLLLGALCFILRDFMRFIFRKTFTSKRDRSFIDFGEYGTTWFGVIVMALAGFVFYKFSTAFVSYLLSDDLISFFRMMRGVFTVNSDVQHPFMISHLGAGLLGQTLLQFLACFVIYRGLRSFMSYVNEKYDSPTYTEGDVLYFGFFAIILFMALEIFSYSQQMPRISGTVHLLYLAMANTGLICYFFAVSHLHLMMRRRYRRSLPRYVKFSQRVKRILVRPVITIGFTWCIGIILHVPMYLGTQFLENNWMVVLFALLSVLLFYWVVRKVLASGFNYFGAIMFFDSGEALSEPMNKDGMWRNTRFYYAAAALAGMLLLIRPGSFILLFFLLAITLFVFLLFHILMYGAGLLVSLIRSYIRPEIETQIDRKTMSDYLKITAAGMGKSLVPAGVVTLFIFVFISIFPKKYDFSPDKNYVNTVVDAGRQPMLIGRFDGNPCTPASREDIPEFMIRCLQWQEDRDFSNQRSWLPKWSNWYGISMASFYRMISGTGGGSNLNMQLIKNEAFPGTFPRDFQRKYTEMLSAYQLSLRLTPDQIVTRYVNQVGMIGGIGHQGVVMAAYHAFDRSLTELNELEQLYLVSSLKRSNLFKAGERYIAYYEASYYADEIKRALLSEVRRWYEQGLLSAEEISTLEQQILRFRKESKSDAIAVTTREFLKRKMPDPEKTGYTYVTTLNHENQDRITAAVDKFEHHFRNNIKLNGYELYSAALVVDVATGKVLGHHGGRGVTDLSTLSGGSPVGSVIKPFILLELMEQGHEPDGLRLYDGKVKGRFTPNNYSRRYSNQDKDINEIISKSLNAPMVNVRLLEEPIGLFREVEKRFELQGISNDMFLDLEDAGKSGEYEVNYPLGSRNMKLFDIAQAYQTLLNDGVFEELRLYDKAFDPVKREHQVISQRARRIYSVNNANAVKEAMHHTMLPGGTGTHIKHLLPQGPRYYAKTGTSDEAKHGYTVLSDGQVLIVSYVTYGKVEGEHLELNATPPIPYGSGVRSAGVLAAFIYEQLEPAVAVKLAAQ